MRVDPTIPQKEEIYQVIRDVLENSATKLFLSRPMFQKYSCNSSEFVETPSEEELLTFLIELGYKGLLDHLARMFVDHMHQPWRTLAAIINK
nr:hypothetical protein [Tanacetum cinerariifolium]